MSVRAVIIGLVLGLAIAGFTYFNDFVIIQTMLIGNFLPLSVFGVLMLLIFAVNPLLRVFGPSVPLRAAELAIIGAIALGACGFPASGFFRGFSTTAGLAGHWYKTETGWQAVEAMSYFPSGSPTIAPGHVRGPGDLAESLAGAVDAIEAGGAPTGLTVVASMLDDQGVYVVTSLANAERLPLDAPEQLATVLNGQVVTPISGGRTQALWERLRAVDALPGPAGVYLDKRQALENLAQEALEEQKAIEAELAAWRQGEGVEAAPLRAQISELGSQISRLREKPEENAEQIAQLERDRRAVEAEFSPMDRHQRALSQAASLAGNRASYYAAEALVMEQRANRAALTALTAGTLLEQPHDEPGLLHTRSDPFVTDTLLEGRAAGQELGISELPWYAWGPTVMRWWPLLACLAFLGLGMALVVHPQWSKRELLSYPIPRFVDEVAEREPGAWLPTVGKNKLFWVAFFALVGLHLVNGMDAWLQIGVNIPMRLDFNPMKELFPLLSRVRYNNAYFAPTIYLSVMAFAFFLSTQASFSVGISQFLYMLLGAAMLAQGVSLQDDYMGAKNGNMIRFGAYVGIFLMILYTGRRYYLNVLASSVGFKRKADTPAYATWAMRLMVVSFVGMVALLTSMGIEWFYAVILGLLVLLIITVISRVVCETGMFFIQPVWVPVGIMTGLLGFEALGPTQYLLLGLASVMLVIDPREVIAPFLTNALKMGESTGRSSPGKVAGWLGVMIVSGILVAGVATLYFQYNKGVNRADGWTRKALPSHTFQNFSLYAADARGQGTLAESAAAEGLEKLSLINVDETLYVWMAVGIGLVLVTAAARLRLPWWPLHPVAFVVWGTYPISQFAFSFLLGWMIKAAVVKTAGAKGYQSAKPLMIGVIAGELFMGLLWIAVGTVYYLVTNQQPTNYRIFPG